MKEQPMTPDPDETDDDATETGEAAASPGVAAALPVDADVTRLASEAELADLAHLRMAAPRRRKRMLGFVGFLLLGFIAVVVTLALDRAEDTITWPGEADGSYDDVRKLLRVDEDVALLVYWPNGPQNVVSGDGTNVIDVIAGVGCRRDVPLHLRVTKTVLTNGLVTTTADSFAAWKRARLAEDWAFDVPSEQLVFLNQQESGYPAWKIKFGRMVDGRTIGGVALYIRHLDKEIVLIRELSVAYWGRAEHLLNGYPCIAANLKAVRERFEIPAVRETGDFVEQISDMYQAVQNDFLASDWRILDRTIRSLILSAIESGDGQRQQNAFFLYMAFRMHLQNWYVGQCLAFQNTFAEENAGRKDCAAVRTAIRRECARRLPDESDSRQWRIAQDDWSVQ